MKEEWRLMAWRNHATCAIGLSVWWGGIWNVRLQLALWTISLEIPRLFREARDAE
jgi:hypothetical protein